MCPRKDYPDYTSINIKKKTRDDLHKAKKILNLHSLDELLNLILQEFLKQRSDKNETR